MTGERVVAGHGEQVTTPRALRHPRAPTSASQRSQHLRARRTEVASFITSEWESLLSGSQLPVFGTPTFSLIFANKRSAIP